MPALLKSVAETAIRDFTDDSKIEDPQMVILVIMGHGDGQSFKLSGEDLEESWVVEQFGSNHCKKLTEKPKMLVFVNCR